jgi:hypothetical protein
MASISAKTSYADALKFHGKLLHNDQGIPLVTLLEKQTSNEPRRAALLDGSSQNIPMVKLLASKSDNQPKLQLPPSITNLISNSVVSSFLHKPPIQPLNPPAQIQSLPKRPGKPRTSVRG